MAKDKGLAPVTKHEQPLKSGGQSGGHRDELGRFQPGHALPGPGRPPRAVEERRLEIASEECPEERWRAICARAVADAVAGDPIARNWLTRLFKLDAPEAGVSVEVGRSYAHILARPGSTEKISALLDAVFAEDASARTIDATPPMRDAAP